MGFGAILGLDFEVLGGLTYAADLFGDVVDSFVSATDHHFVDNNLLCAQDNSIFAHNSANSANIIKMNKK